MKSILLLTLSLMSIVAHAGSVDAITSILSVGTHQGTNSRGDCTITVREVNYPSTAVSITATSATGEFFKLVEDGTDYHTVPGRKLFVQVDHASIGDDENSYVEKILRTALSDTHEGKLYVVVAERTVVRGFSSEDKVECDIDL